MTIPSPYYFVPLSERIFFPPWGAQASMDLPFQEGISGTIEIKVTAATPIYIRNGGGHDKESAEHNDFFRVVADGRHAINGSTFKGMLRSIVEIAAFGKLRQVETDRSFSCRELKGPNAGEYTSRMTTQTSPHKPNALAGWLRQREGGEWVIEPQEFARVEIDELINLYPTKPKPELRKRQTAVEKYTKWGAIPRAISFDFLRENRAKPNDTMVTVHDHSCPCHGQRLLSYKKAAEGTVKLGAGGEQEGVIVFTGQPQEYRPGERHQKHMEFIFYPPATAQAPLSVSPEARREFNQLHAMPNGGPNAEWQHWQKELGKGGRVPVFYLHAADGSPQHMGLAMMFRLPYRHGVKRAITNVHADHLEAYPLDLAEVVFGQAAGEAGLRGRVSVGPLLETTESSPLEEVVTTLNQPRTTYYPNYLQQTVKPNGRVSTYHDYNNDKVKVKGRKRYPVGHDGHDPLKKLPKPPKADMRVTFCPLPAGTTFEGVIHLHNLRPEELGALVWALTWGGRDKLRHSIGMAKPFGFGSIQVEITGQALRCITGTVLRGGDLEKCRERFTAMMEEWFNPTAGGWSWRKSEPLTELLALADPGCHARTPDDLLQYPRLPDFARYKKDHKALRRYTEQSGGEGR